MRIAWCRNGKGAPVRDAVRAGADACGYGFAERDASAGPDPRADVHVTYGWVNGAAGVVGQCRAEGRPWLYVDNGYLGAGRWGGFFRITRGALQVEHGGGLPPSHSRLAAHDVALRPWRSSAAAGHVLVVLQSLEWFEFVGGGEGRETWLQRVQREIRAQTDREIRIRDKTETGRAASRRNPRPISSDLEGAWAAVTHSSNAAVEAVVAGVPAFCLGHGPARTLGNTSLARIEAPQLVGDGIRLDWLAWLAANQWTLGEIASGEPLGDLLR